MTRTSLTSVEPPCTDNGWYHLLYFPRSLDWHPVTQHMTANRSDCASRPPLRLLPSAATTPERWTPVPSSRRDRTTRPVRPITLLLLTMTILLLIPDAWAAAQVPAESPAPDAMGGVQTIHGIAGPDVGLGGDAAPFAALTDLTAFIDRDLTAPLDPAGQVIAPLSAVAGQPVFDLNLPVRPPGQSHAFGTAMTPGIQLFSVNVHADLGGSPFLDPWEYSAWPTGYSSLRLATGTFEITGGRLLIWSDGTEQQVPSGAGTDGLLLTDDDPVMTIAPGWTLLDLDTAPFTPIRDHSVDVLIVSGFGGVRDFSAWGYVASFDQLILNLRTGYPFTELKRIDWDRIVATYRPEIIAAEAATDADAYTGALMRLSVEIGDGHLAVAPSLNILRDRFGGSVGLRLARTDRGQVIVTDVSPGSPADQVGVQPGAVIALWDGLPPAEALAAIETVQPNSTGPARSAQQLNLLPLGPIGSGVAVAVRAVGDVSARTVTLVRTEDIEGVDRLVSRDPASVERRVHSPVESRLLDPRTGYIRVSTFAATPALVVAGWDNAIHGMQAAGAESLVLDLRGNPGGVLSVAVYLASSFITQPVNLADLSIANDAGQWGLSGKLIARPNDALWRGNVAVLIDSGCVSACEVLAAALAANPATVVAGTEPTGGVVATVAFWALPTGGVFQAPLGRFIHGDTVWLEGQGVPPTLDVPVTSASVLSENDQVLDAALAELER